MTQRPNDVDAAPWPDTFPGLDLGLIDSLLRRGQNSDVPGVLAACERWIDQLGDTDPDTVAWLLLISFYATQAEGAVHRGVRIADRMVSLARSCTSALWESIAHSSRAVALIVDGRGALSHRDLAIASVVLDSHLPDRTQGPDVEQNVIAASLPSTACNAVAFALVRLGLLQEALVRLEQVELHSLDHDEGSATGLYVVKFNQGWVQLHLGFEADLDGLSACAQDHYRSARRSFGSARDHRPTHSRGPEWRESAAMLAEVAAAMDGDPSAAAPLERHLERDDVRPGHRPIALLGAAHLALLAGDRDRVLALTDRALAVLAPDPSVNALRGRILTERVAAAATAEPTPSTGALQDLVSALLRDRRREQLARSDSVHEAVEVERHRRTIRITERALLIDELTGLGNRRMLDARFTEVVRDAAAAGVDLSVVFIDIDHFKEVNDRSSHLVGDLVLRLLGTGIQLSCSPEDVAIRFGGDEFLLLLWGRSAADAAELTEEIRNRFLVEVAAVPEVSMTIGFSAGVVQAAPGWSSDALLLAADEAMLGGKRAGRNRIVLGDTDPKDHPGLSGE